MNKQRLLHGLLPALLLNLSIGSVYAFTSLSGALLEAMSYNKAEIQFAFSLAIFFFGTSAAFFGNLVERNTKKSSLISCLAFTAGLIIGGIGVKLNSLLLLYLGYGGIMGIGLGTGYLTPVKSLMQWYPNNKGLSTGLAVTFFGLAATFAAPVIKALLSATTAANAMLWLALIYFIPTFLSFLLIKKPEGVKIKEKTARHRVAYFLYLHPLRPGNHSFGFGYFCQLRCKCRRHYNAYQFNRSFQRCGTFVFFGSFRPSAPQNPHLCRNFCFGNSRLSADFVRC